MLIYRLVGWIFISAIGWVVFFLMFFTEGALDPDTVVEELAAQEVADLEARRAARPGRHRPAGPLPHRPGAGPRPGRRRAELNILEHHGHSRADPNQPATFQRPRAR